MGSDKQFLFETYYNDFQKIEDEFRSNYSISGLRNRIYARLGEVKDDPAFIPAWEKFKRNQFRRFDRLLQTLYKNVRNGIVKSSYALDVEARYKDILDRISRKPLSAYQKIPDMYQSIRKFTGRKLKPERTQTSKQGEDGYHTCAIVAHVAHVVKHKYPDIFKLVEMTHMGEKGLVRQFVVDKLTQLKVDSAVIYELFRDKTLSWNEYVLEIRPFVKAKS